MFFVLFTAVKDLGHLSWSGKFSYYLSDFCLSLKFHRFQVTSKEIKTKRIKRKTKLLQNLQPLVKSENLYASY